MINVIINQPMINKCLYKYKITLYLNPITYKELLLVLTKVKLNVLIGKDNKCNWMINIKRKELIINKKDNK